MVCGVTDENRECDNAAEFIFKRWNSKRNGDGNIIFSQVNGVVADIGLSQYDSTQYL